MVYVAILRRPTAIHAMRVVYYLILKKVAIDRTIKDMKYEIDN